MIFCELLLFTWYFQIFYVICFILRSRHRIRPIPRLILYMGFVTISCSYDEGLLALRPNPKMQDHPLSIVRDYLFNIFTVTLLHFMDPLTYLMANKTKFPPAYMQARHRTGIGSLYRVWKRRHYFSQEMKFTCRIGFDHNRQDSGINAGLIGI